TPTPLLPHTPHTRTPPRPPLFPYTTLFRSPCLELGDRVSERLVERLRVPGPLALAQDADALPFLGEIHEVEVDGEGRGGGPGHRSEEHTSELQSRFDLVCRLLLEKKK